MNIDPMITTLIDLVRTIDQRAFRLIVGGGFGLYLKQVHQQSQPGIRTLLPGEMWPYPRATEDLDLFLPAEILINLDAMKGIRLALDQLGFLPVAQARFMQFEKRSGRSGKLKIDLLTGPVPVNISPGQLKLDGIRARPRGDVQLHAHLTPEALGIEDESLLITLNGKSSEGQDGSVQVHVPQPFTYLLMKLHAMADRVNRAESDLGRHHALDVYRIIAMLTMQEYRDLGERIVSNTDQAPVVRSRQIVWELFQTTQSVGSLRLREHPLFGPAMDVQQFIDVLKELFQ